jgi:hypothetical protein
MLYTYVVGVCMHTKLSPLLNCAHRESPRQQASALLSLAHCGTAWRPSRVGVLARVA